MRNTEKTYQELSDKIFSEESAVLWKEFQRDRTIAERLIRFSMQKNFFHPDKHRKVVWVVLSVVVEYDVLLAQKLGKAQKKYFRGEMSYDASRFYWYYGSALMQLKDEKRAMETLRCCHEICKKIGDDQSWISARVGIIVNTQDVFEGVNGEQAERYLWDAVQKIDEGYYKDAGKDAEYVAALTRFTLFHKRMNDKNLRGLLPEIEKYYAYCKKTNEQAIHPRLTIKAAENILGGYYAEIGDHLSAIEHFWNAMFTPQPNGLPNVLEDDLLYTNLLIEYGILNDRKEVARIVQILKNNMRNYDEEDETYQRISAALRYAEMIDNTTTKEKINDARRKLNDIYNKLNKEGSME